jgi:hypothetical protein
MSAAAGKRMGEAQRKRWAESRGQVGTPSETVTAKPKRKLSAAGKAAIVAALKKRWAAKKTTAKAPLVKSSESGLSWIFQYTKCDGLGHVYLDSCRSNLQHYTGAATDHRLPPKMFETRQSRDAA